MLVKMRFSTRPTPEVTTEIEWRPARWLGSSAEVTPTHSLVQALQRNTRRLFAAARVAPAADKNEVAVAGTRRRTTCAPAMSTRAHNVHLPLAARKRSEPGSSQQNYLIAAAAVQMGAQRPLAGDVRAIDWRGAWHPPQPLAR